MKRLWKARIYNFRFGIRTCLICPIDLKMPNKSSFWYALLWHWNLYEKFTVPFLLKRHKRKRISDVDDGIDVDDSNSAQLIPKSTNVPLLNCYNEYAAIMQMYRGPFIDRIWWKIRRSAETDKPLVITNFLCTCLANSWGREQWQWCQDELFISEQTGMCCQWNV